MPTRPHSTLLFLLIFVLAPLTLLYQALANVRISLFRLDTQVVTLTIFLISVATGLLLVRFGPRIRISALAVVFFLFLEVAIGFRDLFATLLTLSPVSLQVLAVGMKVLALIMIAIVVFALLWKLRTFSVQILAAFFSVAFLSTLVTQPWPKIRHSTTPAQTEWVTRETTSVSPPIVLHLVLDELLAPEAIERDIPGGEAAYQAMLDFARRYHFRLYGRVYGRHYFSARALRNLLNAEFLNLPEQGHLSFSKAVKIDRNAYFDEMKGRGYDIAVFGTSHMDFCAYPDVEICNTFDSFDPKWSADNLELQDLTAKTRMGYILYTVLESFSGSYSAKYSSALVVDFLLGGRTPGVEGSPNRFDVQGFPRWFDEVSHNVLNAPRGTLIFTHFLVPHAPYLLTEECAVSGKWEHGYYLERRFGSGSEMMERKRTEALAAYYAQTQCVLKKLSSLMRYVTTSERFDDATIIIHGDHGSRISVGNVLESYADRDFIANYATFFAVRSPEVLPGYDCRFVSLPRVFMEYARREPLSRPPHSAPAPIFVSPLEDSDELVAAAMPELPCTHVNDGFPPPRGGSTVRAGS